MIKTINSDKTNLFYELYCNLLFFIKGTFQSMHIETRKFSRQRAKLSSKDYFSSITLFNTLPVCFNLFFQCIIILNYSLAAGPDAPGVPAGSGVDEGTPGCGSG